MDTRSIDSGSMNLGLVSGIKNKLPGTTNASSCSDKYNAIRFSREFELPECILTRDTGEFKVRLSINPRGLTLILGDSRKDYNNAIMDFGEDGDAFWINAMRDIFDNAKFEMEGELVATENNLMSIIKGRISKIDIANCNYVTDPSNKIRQWFT